MIHHESLAFAVCGLAARSASARRPLGMMEGIDSSFARVIFIGEYASKSSTIGVRAHTPSSTLLERIALDGTSMTEAGINAAIAAQDGVPVPALTGDDALVDETQRRLGPIEGGAVKHAIGLSSASMRTPGAARKLIRQQAEAGLARCGHSSS